MNTGTHPRHRTICICSANILVMMLGMVGSLFRVVAPSTRHAPALVCVATIVTLHPASSILTTKLEGQKQRRVSFYGTALLPSDIAYDERAKETLSEMRELKRDDVTEEKVKPLKGSGHKEAATLTLVGYKGGPLETQINQDRSFCFSPYYIKENEEEDASVDRKLLGVFDGHAPLGENVSQFSVEELPKLLANKLAELFQQRNPQDVVQEETEAIKEILVETFVELDKKCPGEISGGCTASVILQQGPKVYVANAGDSCSFLVLYRAKTKEVKIVYMSREDKPDLPDERQRVEAMGGQVYLPYMGTSRVLYIDPATGVQSGLAMSRSIGDWAAGKLGVIPDPIVGVIDINDLVTDQLSSDDDDGLAWDEYGGSSTVRAIQSEEEDDIHVFAVSATDGLTDYAPAEAIAKVLATSLYADDGPHLLTACEQLIYYAAQGWFQTRGGQYRDDIAIAVSKLRSPSNDKGR